MAQKSYQQYCGIAAALDVVGDRWTILILRELSFGERRFTDLQRSLPGIATNLLTDRLRDLAHAGVVAQRELPPPAARSVYALTTAGEEIRPVLMALARFGLRFLDDPVEGRVRPRMAVHGTLAALFDPTQASEADLSVRFDLDGEQQWLQVGDSVLVTPEKDRQPDLVVSGTSAALVAVCLRPGELAVEERLTLTGTSAARATFARVFRLSERASV